MATQELPEQPRGWPPQQYAPPSQDPYPPPRPAYYAPHGGPVFNIRVLAGIGMILAAVGFMITGGMYFWEVNAKGDDYKTILNIWGICWILVGIGFILMAIAEFVKGMRKA